MNFDEFKTFLDKTPGCDSALRFASTQKSMQDYIKNCTEIAWLWWLLDESAKDVRKDYHVKINPALDSYRAKVKPFQDNWNAISDPLRARYCTDTASIWADTCKEIVPILKSVLLVHYSA
jgi:hypothetical protein